MTERFEPTGRTRLRRKAFRAAYEKDAVFAILDGALVAHIAYVSEGEAVCTATAIWREGERLFWHGAAAGRAVQAQTDGQRVCVTVSHLDGLVLGRSGFTHSVLFRSVMAFGHPRAVTGREAKRAAMDAFIGGLYPGRPAELRPAHDAELDAIVVVAMPIEEASAKVRGGGVLDREPDLAAPCWAGILPMTLVAGEAQADAAQPPGRAAPPGLAAYRPGQPVESALRRRALT